MLRFYPRHFKAASRPIRPDTPDKKESGARQGFSVLEAMVAMAILAAGLLPILALQGQFVKTVEQLEHVDQRLAVQDNVLNAIQNINLTEKPTGQLDFGDVVASWEAVPAVPARMGRGLGGFPGRFELTLYDVRVQVDYNYDRQENFSVRGIGWRALTPYLSGL